MYIKCISRCIKTYINVLNFLFKFLILSRLKLNFEVQFIIGKCWYRNNTNSLCSFRHYPKTINNINNLAHLFDAMKYQYNLTKKAWFKANRFHQPYSFLMQ